MMQAKFLVLSVLGLIGVCVGQFVQNGQCDQNVPLVQGFNVTQYLGRWRIIEKYTSRLDEIRTCEEATYTLGANGTVTVFNSEVFNQTLASITGTAEVSADGSGRLSVTFPNSTTQTDYWILATDYQSYSLVYSCVNIDAEHREVRGWKFSRTRQLSPVANTAINNAMANVDVLDNRYFERISHTDEACFYLPDLAPEQPVVFPGQCDPNIAAIQNFNAGRYLGLWRLIENYPSDYRRGKCGEMMYFFGRNGTFIVNYTQVDDQSLSTITGSASLTATDSTGRLTVTIPNSSAPAEYLVLDTDYDNYALLYSCSNIGNNQRRVWSWKISRRNSLSQDSVAAINLAMDRFDVLDNRYFQIVDRSDAACFYFPEPSNNPPVFRGQCDPNINVVRNFDVVRYMGLWHEIESYPRSFQVGTCNNAFYSLINGTVDVFNTQVIDQTLQTINGQAVLAATDGSARLTMSFPGTSTSFATRTDYWVLATDYQSYSLVYSCFNLDAEHRQVTSWKLSRTKQLTTAVSTAINNVINNVDVLDQRYYLSRDQSPNGCFYIPEPQPGEPVVLSGQCDTNIAVVPNFNMTLFQGSWYEIESYPSTQQSGQCISHQFSAGTGNTLNLVSNNVLNQALAVSNGTVTFSDANDNSARLTVTITTNGTNILIPVWILSTDYTSYALAYTCINVDNNSQAVWSWKMSRTNSLSQNAVTAINQVINRVNVLENRYFQTVDRSDAACFYFPEPSPSPVVFRGQCDQNIRVMQNFNAASYMGTWYDIQSYPTPFQGGTCNTARYTLNAGGVVSVVNTQVVDQQLRTMNGSAVQTSTDGSARLSVTFLVEGVNVTTDYWVLDTDYTSYALVYSCRNLDSERHEVNSWKLSRQQSLTPAANTAINNVINSVQVLRQDYYLQRDHSSTGCFFYPDNLGGDVILEGQCLLHNLVGGVTNFNVNAFAGIWHEVARFPSDLQTGECAASQYVMVGHDSFNITQTIVREERLLSSFVPSASVASDGRGVISANITGVPFSDVFVLATDYIEYALLYSCRNLSNNTKQIYSWKLSRSRAGLSANANNSINSVVSNNIDLFEGYYRYTDQSNNGCFHYPIFDVTPAFIELPGPCDQSVRGVSNFDSSAYLGRWFEIARYPTTRQQGQCNRAEYSASNTGLVVTNNQVLDQTLSTISGTAVLASNDGSGLFNVTFIVGGVPQVASYYVLATDYTNFALVYYCSNLANGNKRVGSWKLSRTTYLSTQANNIMDSVIGSTKGLLEEYYQPTSQSEESCFYIPEVNPNQAPLFRGQCENITQTIQNFSVERFLGWWHEIERFPVDELVGECVSSQYQQSRNENLVVVDTRVLNSSATVVTANLVATSNGQLRRTLPSGQVEDIWVLSTDYETYALLYWCANVGTEYQRIWSAKHSRARSLTQAAQNAMAPLINASRVLYPQFYLPVDQSDRACFHYPEPTGQQIIIPGQCDMNIPVVQNFDVVAYGGTWYQIERYPQIHEGGTCIGARHTLDANTGVVAVLNWEVINGTLVTIEGSAVLQYNDSSARLLVTLPVVGTNETVTTSLYVLATDYESYGLAYSCYNVNSFQRAIGAWKLSRARTMSDAGTAAIDAVMQRREELHQPYFRQIEQSKDCEEPSSALTVSSSVAVLLVCALIQLLV